LNFFEDYNKLNIKILPVLSKT